MVIYSIVKTMYNLNIFIATEGECNNEISGNVL